MFNSKFHSGAKYSLELSVRRKRGGEESGRMGERERGRKRERESGRMGEKMRGREGERFTCA
jgi:hypothetical protein